MPVFVFRKAKYPVLIETDAGVFGALNGTQLTRVFKKNTFAQKNEYKLVDCGGEVWRYYAKMDKIAPWIMQERCTKVKLVEFYNSHRQEGDEGEFLARSLGNKRMEQLIAEIIEFRTPSKPSKRRTKVVVQGQATAKKNAAYTEKQGQYLAFIDTYEILNGRAPAEADMLRFFRTTPPTVHQMILKLEEKGFISRVPRTARSIKLLIDPQELPKLKR